MTVKNCSFVTSTATKYVLCYPLSNLKKTSVLLVLQTATDAAPPSVGWSEIRTQNLNKKLRPILLSHYTFP